MTPEVKTVRGRNFLIEHGGAANTFDTFWAEGVIRAAEQPPGFFQPLPYPMSRSSSARR